MGIMNFNGISGMMATRLLYGFVGLLQIIVLFLQWFGVNQELADHCPADATTTQRETANWSAWLNGIGLILCGLWVMAMRRKMSPLIVWSVKIVWIASVAISSLLAAVSMGHTLTIGSICTDEKFDAETVRDTSVTILVLWILLLGLGHMGASNRKKMEANYSPIAQEPEKVEETNVKLYKQSNQLVF